MHYCCNRVQFKIFRSYSMLYENIHRLFYLKIFVHELSLSSEPLRRKTLHIESINIQMRDNKISHSKTSFQIVVSKRRITALIAFESIVAPENQKIHL